jgi:NAD(P)-dependent dehydrogenase (short-subunit alcohol dehydrogenase family)
MISERELQSLRGKIIVITGANRGIGLALVRRFVGLGAQVVGVVRSAQAAKTLAAACADVAVEICELTDDAAVGALAQRVSARFGHVDVLVNNAGVYLDRGVPTERLDVEVMRATFATNLFATVAMCSAFCELIPRGGRIINVSSIMGQLAGGLDGESAAYAVSKTALNGYTSSLSAALDSRGIFVDAMHPGWVKTQLGGPNAKLEPEASTETVVFLAARADGESGRLWRDGVLIDW